MPCWPRRSRCGSVWPRPSIPGSRRPASSKARETPVSRLASTLHFRSSPAGAGGARARRRGRILLLTSSILVTLAAYASVAIDAVSPAPARFGAALPPPPYARFAGQTFEPSAAAFDPATGRVLVFSDHDSILYRYQLTPAGRGVFPGGAPPRFGCQTACRSQSSRG